MVLTATTISTTQLIVTPTTVMPAWKPIGNHYENDQDDLVNHLSNWQKWGYKSAQDCYKMGRNGATGGLQDVVGPSRARACHALLPNNYTNT